MNNNNKNSTRSVGKRELWQRPIFLLSSLFAGLLLLLLARVIAAPIYSGFVGQFVQSQFAAQIGDKQNFDIEFKQSGFQLINGIEPSLRLEDVRMIDRDSGAFVFAQQVDVSWHGPSAIVGHPALKAKIVQPNIQLVQDYNGIRLAQIVAEGDDEGKPIVRLVGDGKNTARIKVTNDGVVATDEHAAASAGVRSDNAWAIESVESIENLFSQFSVNTKEASFLHFDVVGGRIEIVDLIYQLYRQLENVNLRLMPSGDDVRLDFDFRTGELETGGEMVWSLKGDERRKVIGQFTNIDLALVLPFIDDEDGVFALKGGTNMSFDVDYAAQGVEHGLYKIDVSSAKAAILSDLFEITAEPAEIEWFPHEARYILRPFVLQVGQSSSTIEGQFKLGLDKDYGPTMAYSIKLEDTILHPNDMAAPSAPWDEISVAGWSAPLYGATGIDNLVLRDDTFELDARGRVDVVQKGMGFDITMYGKGATADDLKRIWPYFLAPDARDWLIKNVKAGQIDEARVRLNFPVGTVGKPGEDRRIPDGGLSIEGTARDVELLPLPGFPVIEIDGTTSILMKDHYLELGFDHAVVRDESGVVELENVAYLNQDSGAKEQLFELSGQLKGAVSTLVAIANREPLNLLEDFDLEYQPEDLKGNADVQVIATISQDEQAILKGVDYSLSGTVDNFTSRKPIEGRVVRAGTASFTASQEGYRISGRANVDGLDTNLLVEGKDDQDPIVTASATLTEADRERLGVDLSQFVEGPLRFVARPVGELVQVAVDLTDARLKFAELGIDKKKGVKGELKATLLLDDKQVDAQTLDLKFADVRAAGSLIYDFEKGLRAANLIDLVLNKGDRASVSMAPIDGGYKVEVVGEQLDLKPMLKQFVGLDEGAPQATSNAEEQIIDISVKLDRALGFYKTTAYDVNGHLNFKGADFTRVDLQMSLGNTKVVSIATNPVPSGRLMSAATNDLGTLLRFTGTYSRLLNGVASLALDIDTKDKKNAGEFVLSDFALLDEGKVAQILGNHADSRKLIERENRVNFRKAQAKFYRRGDVITVEEASLDGGTFGGTMRGSIYSAKREYDLVGTYIPLFGLNNIFQKLPLFGQILGGRDGEGLLGVTFAVRGPLDDPKFVVNPASILAPGVLRRIFEFRAREGDEEARRALDAVDAGDVN